MSAIEQDEGDALWDERYGIDYDTFLDCLAEIRRKERSRALAEATETVKAQLLRLTGPSDEAWDGRVDSGYRDAIADVLAALAAVTGEVPHE